MPSRLRTPLPFPVPARDPHHGIPLGNGTFGALLWGEGRVVRVTINRADYWDRRGGLPPRPEATYANLRQWLANGEEARVREVFEGRPPGGGEPAPQPTRLPMGRIDLELPEGAPLTGARLDMATGTATFEAGGSRLEAVVLRDLPVLLLTLRGPDAGQVKAVPRPADAPEVREYYRKRRIPDPIPFTDPQGGGWVQEAPEGPALCVRVRRFATDAAHDVTWIVTAIYGETGEAARDAAAAMLARVAAEREALLAASRAGWEAWWARAARLSVPEPTLDLLYHLGMYKLAGLSVPGSPAATLQGPWVEEHRMPPWSSDYHWNINVQECYWPAYGGNHPEALEPLFAMLRSWVPRLRENARRFLGIEDGLVLPHATDDRGTGMTGFWTGAVDHGSTAWAGQLMWHYYRVTGDREFLRDTAYPFLKGCLRAYEAMLIEEGDSLALPMGVSPEYGGAGGEAWGKNASFQLAIIHFLCRTLARASETLGIDAEERAGWAAIGRKLPLASLGPAGRGQELLIWDGQPLAESHRHHSHLAGLYPFDLFDLDGNETEATIVRQSMQRLTRMGTGLWTGWCVPWAAILHARVGNGGAAALMLDAFRRAFMGPGYASTHDAVTPGFTLFTGRPDIMQVEACMGAAAAVLEMLGHCRGGTLRLFPAIPAGWEEASFENLRVEGAFLVSGQWQGGRPASLTLRSEAGLPLRLANPWGEAAVRIIRDGKDAGRAEGRVLTRETHAGEAITLVPVEKA